MVHAACREQGDAAATCVFPAGAGCGVLAAALSGIEATGHA